MKQGYEEGATTILSEQAAELVASRPRQTAAPDYASELPPSCEQITWWMWPHVLSVDVVGVFASWTLLLAHSFGAAAKGATLLAGGACVWSIYIGDHLMDARQGRKLAAARHQFVFRHRRWFGAALLVAIATGATTAAALPPSVRRLGYLLSAAVVLYVLLVHSGGERLRSSWPREIAVALLFAVGTAVGVLASRFNVLALFGIVLVAAVFVLNCAGLEYHEWRSRQLSARPHCSVIWIATHGLPLALALVATCAAASSFHLLRPIALAAGASAVLHLGLFARARRLSSSHLRALSDLALLMPALLTLFLISR